MQFVIQCKNKKKNRIMNDCAKINALDFRVWGVFLLFPFHFHHIVQQE